jgi:hypothetical protein
MKLIEFHICHAVQKKLHAVNDERKGMEMVVILASRVPDTL